MEGPSIVLLIGEASKFVGKKVLEASGVVKIPMDSLTGHKLVELRSWGKHFFLVFPRITLRVHFLMFGSYRVDEPKPEREPKLSLKFRNGTLYFYSCAIGQINEHLDSLYDSRCDLMSDTWNEKLALRKLESLPGTLVCDALLDQEIFAGAGNIIKNEVLFRLGLHPKLQIKDLTGIELRLLTRSMRHYSLQFFFWKKEFVLRKHWQVFKRKLCTVCGSKLSLEHTGKLKRRTFYCTRCQPRRRTSPRDEKALKRKLKKVGAEITALQALFSSLDFAKSA
jgi:endonuclease VIII